MRFWIGFEKRAAGLGQISGLGHFGSRAAGRVVGARPSPLMATVGSFKPNAIPTATVAPAKAALAPKVNTGVSAMPHQRARGTSSMVI